MERRPFFRPGVLDAPDFAAAIAATHALLLDLAAPTLVKETRFLALLAAWVARYAERTPVRPPPGRNPRPYGASWNSWTPIGTRTSA